MRRATVLPVMVMLAATVANPSAKSLQREAQVYVLLWFDTEDYLLPASDDAALRLAEFLTAEQIRGTFKLVGEKARVLEQRKRRDVIEALRKHEIGYHTDFHSVHPTPAEFLSRHGWFDGVAEFERRERQGFLDTQRILGQKPTCYGQPGSSWGPQAYGALRKWGVPVYLDVGSHVSLNREPFWYCGILNFFSLKAVLRTGLGAKEELEKAKREFARAYERLLAEGGGPVSIYYHPAEFAHRQFWDAVNFSKGANPPRSKWKVPPEKSADEKNLAHEIFQEYVRFIKSHPRVRFITASDAFEVYRDGAHGRSFHGKEIQEIAARIQRDGLTYQIFDAMSLSPSEQLLLLNEFAFQKIAGGSGENNLTGTPFGPTEAAPEHSVVSVTRSQFERTVVDVREYLKLHGHVPNVVWLGSQSVSPESYLAALARAATVLVNGRPLPEMLELTPAKLMTAQYVQDDDPKLWEWIIFPPAFRAPEMMRLAKLQAWTLKPALLYK